LTTRILNLILGVDDLNFSVLFINMPEWDEFLDLVGNDCARGIFRTVRDYNRREEPLYINELARITGYSNPTIITYVNIMVDALIIKKSISETLIKDDHSRLGKPIRRFRTAIIKELKIAGTYEAELFGKILDKEI